MDREPNGATIRAIRKGLGISQAALAGRAGITSAYMCMIERELRRPSLDVLRRIAAELDVPLGVISYIAPEPKKVAS